MPRCYRAYRAGFTLAADARESRVIGAIHDTIHELRSSPLPPSENPIKQQRWRKISRVCAMACVTIFVGTPINTHNAFADPKRRYNLTIAGESPCSSTAQYNCEKPLDDRRHRYLWRPSARPLSFYPLALRNDSGRLQSRGPM